MATPFVEYEWPAFSVDYYVGECSFYEETCDLLSDEENRMLKSSLHSYLIKTPRTHDQACNYVSRFVDIMFIDD